MIISFTLTIACHACALSRHTHDVRRQFKIPHTRTYAHAFECRAFNNIRRIKSWNHCNQLKLVAANETKCNGNNDLKLKGNNKHVNWLTLSTSSCTKTVVSSPLCWFCLDLNRVKEFPFFSPQSKIVRFVLFFLGWKFRLTDYHYERCILTYCFRLIVVYVSFICVCVRLCALTSI